MTVLRPDDLFPVQGAIPEERQIGRAGAIEAVLQRVLDGDDVIVIEPRRVGKTSFLQNGALRRAQKDHGAVVAAVDLHATPIKAGQALAEALLSAARETGAGRPVTKVKAGNLLARARHAVKGSRANAAGEVTGETNAVATAERLLEIFAPDGSAGLRQVLAALEADAEIHGRPVAVFIDEAQELAKWGDGRDVQEELARAMRRSHRKVAYVFAGSEHTAMEALFDAKSPLHREGERYRLPDIAPEDWHHGLRARFAEASIEIGHDEIDAILDASGGHPLRTMQVCKQAYREVRDSGEPVTSTIVAAAIAAAREQPSWREADDE